MKFPHNLDTLYLQGFQCGTVKWCKHVLRKKWRNNFLKICVNINFEWNGGSFKICKNNLFKLVVYRILKAYHVSKVHISKAYYVQNNIKGIPWQKRAKMCSRHMAHHILPGTLASGMSQYMASHLHLAVWHIILASLACHCHSLVVVGRLV